MKLEEEIVQEKFKSEQEKAILNILFTGNWITSFSSKFLKSYNLTPQQYNVLRILRGQHPHKVALHVVQARMLDKMSNASRLVDKLFKKGWVERKECSNDRRQVDLSITLTGLELLATIDQEYDKMNGYIKNITPEEARVLNQILDKLRK